MSSLPDEVYLFFPSLWFVGLLSFFGEEIFALPTFLAEDP
jgi:hypothetical protein